VSNEVRILLGRAITRLLVGDRQEFYKLATKAEEKYRNDRCLYVTGERDSRCQESRIGGGSK